MRLLFLVLFVLLGLIQYPLWLGKGGWFKVWDLQRQVAEQRETNEGLRARNAALEAEVRDLEGGSGAIEERARGELGMMRDGEVFVHILPQNTQPPAGASLSAEAPPKPAVAGTPARANAPAARPASAAPTTRPASTAATPRPAAATPARPAATTGANNSNSTARQ
ncbi:cell division protein FtsB [Achromobacter sp. Root565]|uniref:cell division protein FtsB n=1 Tax=Achromobacter sp. Root565 TaxID=1736564 RepID=UPI0006FDE7D2|nr:cell division protein FtsB [Achromobacter sp. Root565]KQZ98883.1 cell division protein FtsB [Achromobacter sp. Root565]